MELAVFAGALFGSIAIGMPIAFALLMTALALMFWLGLFDSQLIAENIVSGINNFSLMAIPFFILAGELMSAGGITKRIINVALALLGHKRGGIGYVAIVASVLFASLSGSAVADTIALGSILIPMMVRAGYDRNRSCGLVAASGIIAPIIPPSIPLILFGVTSGLSISKLFIAGLAPGLLMGVLLMMAWWFISRRDETALMESTTAREKLSALRQSVWALVLPLIIVVGLRFGVFTPTEAGVVAAFYALFVGTVVYRELDLAGLYTVLVSSARLTSIVMFLVAASSVAAWLITVADVPGVVSESLAGWEEHPVQLMLLINAVVLLLGMALDLAPLILILTPVLLPVVREAGIDPVYFGIVFVVNLSVGLLTPPVGTVLAAVASVGQTSLAGVVRGIWPFLIVHVILILAMIFFPQIVIYPLELMH